MEHNNTLNTTAESFDLLFEQSIRDEKREGTVVKGIITAMNSDDVFVDVGLKSEGRISKREFTEGGQSFNLSVGDEVDVFIERMEDRYGNTVLSREKAMKEEAWYKFEELHAQNAVIDGEIIGRVKGGYAVRLSGKVIAFLPGSQVDIRPIKDVSALIDVVQPFKILKMDRDQGNVVVSRRAILEESRAEAREALLSNITEGAVLEGTVKNITDYGAFIDLGSVDGLLHITDISWDKISHPSEVLTLGQSLKVMVIKYNEETKRVSLGLKQLQANPWDAFVEKYQSGVKISGTVTTIADYGAFVEVEPGVEGLVYHTEISWNSKNNHPRKLLKAGDKVEVMVLELDVAKHKMSLSIKQCVENPWLSFGEKHPLGSVIEGVIQNVVDFGIFMSLKSSEQEEINGIEALIPATELSWTEKPEDEIKKYEKGQVIKGVIMAIDSERERVTVSIRQMGENGISEALNSLQKGEDVTCTVVAVKKEGVDVELKGGFKTFIKKVDLSKHKSEQRPERFGVGDKIDARIVSVDHATGKLQLSVKLLEVEEEKRAIAEYGSKDSGASLGEILGMALNKDREKDSK
jgi:small subunit ribosomal protein S1